ncbi:hypothetical protein SteCoe_23531 [Stentor coeruleus]|uniref:Uncharacterized protein n=1 Tax=Stentor coeruleus TaxID=5963 RepID=A0A1R2BJN4_9CILI|nr:hypothetical protein SteCoe_23531 [Stentor coeruleus]
MSELPITNAYLNKCSTKYCRNALTIRNYYIGPSNMKYCLECISNFECKYCTSKYIFVSISDTNICFECSWKSFYNGNYPVSVLKGVTNLPGNSQARILIQRFKENFPKLNKPEVNDFYQDKFENTTYYAKLCLSERALSWAYKRCKKRDSILGFQLLLENINILFELGKTTDALAAFRSIKSEETHVENYTTLMDYCGTEYFKKKNMDLDQLSSSLIDDPNDLNACRIKYFIRYKENYYEVEKQLQNLDSHTPINIKLFIDCLRYSELKNLNEESLLNAIHLAKSYCPSYVLISSLYVLLSRFYKCYLGSFDKSLSSLEEAAKVWLKVNVENEFAVKILIKLAKAYIRIDINRSKAIILHCIKFAEGSKYVKIRVKALKVLRNILNSNHEYERVCTVERKLWEIKNSH